MSAYNQDKEELFLRGLEEALDAGGWQYRLRYEYEINEATGQPIACYLEQVVFWKKSQEIFARRFIPDFVMQLDCTFNTNNTRLLLAVVTSVSNTGRSFPALFAYQKTESCQNWLKVLQTMAEILPAAPPKVILSNFGEGLIAAH